MDALVETKIEKDYNPKSQREREMELLTTHPESASIGKRNHDETIDEHPSNHPVKVQKQNSPGSQSNECNEEHKIRELTLEESERMIKSEIERDIGVKLDEVEQGFDESLDELPAPILGKDRFRDFENANDDVVNSVLKTIQASEYSNDQINGLKEYLEGLKTIHYPSPLKIGVRGDSGVGKSHFINSLLGQPHLAKRGNRGEAVTSVPTQFQQKGDRQQSLFRADVILFKHTQIHAMLKEWTHDYNRHRLLRLAGECEQDKNSEGLEPVEQRASAFIDNLASMLGKNDQFQSKDAIREWLDEELSMCEAASVSITSEGAYEPVVNKLLEFCKRLLAGCGVEDLKACVEADDPDILNNEISKYTQSAEAKLDDDGKPTVSLWPLVRLVTVSFDSPLLNRGLIICDLPGLSDTNIARTRSTLREIQSCRFIFVVAQIGRVLTDPNVKNDLRSSFTSHGAFHSLVLTKIDEVDVVDTLEYFGAAQKDISKWNLLSAADSEAKQLQDEARTAKRGKRPDAARLRYKAEPMKDRRRIIACLQKEISIRARNEDVERKLRQKLRDWGKMNDSIGIFFVSNIHYDLHIENKYDETLPMSFEMTGIASFRSYLCNKAEKRKIDALRKHIFEVLPRLVNFLVIYSSDDIHEQIGKLKSLLKGPLGEVRWEIERLEDRINAIRRKAVVDPINSAASQWSEAASKIARRWVELDWRPFNRKIRARGRDVKSKCLGFPHEDWNQVLLDLAKEEITLACDNFAAEVSDEIEALKGKFDQMFDKIQEEMQIYPEEVDKRMVPVCNEIKAARKQLCDESERLRDRFSALTRITLAHLTVVEGSCAILQSTQPMFDRIHDNAVKRTGATEIRRQELLSAVKNQEPYQSIIASVDGAVNLQHKPKFVTDATKFIQMLTGNGMKAIQQIIDHLERSFKQQNDSDPRWLAMRDLLRDCAREAEAEIEGLQRKLYDFDAQNAHHMKVEQD